MVHEQSSSLEEAEMNKPEVMMSVETRADGVPVLGPQR
jgi:hypothetical protein